MIWVIPLVAPVAVAVWLAGRTRARHLARAGMRFPVDAPAEAVVAAIGRLAPRGEGAARITVGPDGPLRHRFSTPAGDRGAIVVEPGPGPSCTVVSHAIHLAARAPADPAPEGGAAALIERLVALVYRWGRVAPNAPALREFQRVLPRRITDELGRGA